MTFSRYKGAFWGVFLPPDKGKIRGQNIFLSKSQTTCPYASNTPPHIKFGPFLCTLSTFLYACTPFFYIFVLKGAFWGSFTPWQDKKLVEGQKNCRKVKLFVYTLLTSHHTSSLDHFWARYQRFCHFYPKRGHFGGVFTPWQGQKFGGQKKICWKVKLLVLTLLTSHHTSNLNHFWALYQL